VFAESLVNLPLELPLGERADPRERIVQKEDKMKSQPRTNARTTRHVALMILWTVMYLVGSGGLFTSTAQVASDFRLSFKPMMAPDPGVPFIDSMSPLSVAPGGGDFTLTVYGAGFVKSVSQIYWNGAALNPTTCTGPTPTTVTQCTATVPAANTATQGTASVTVVDPAQVGAVSNVFFFTIIGPAPSVSFSRKDFAAGNGPSSVAVADFNCDGILDLAIANRQDDTVSILLGNGDGTFQAEKTYATGYTPVSVAVGDFNNDGFLDLAVVNTCGDTLLCTSVTAGTVSILLGNGDGTFTLKSSPDTGEAPTFVAVGDFNGNGNLDLAVANGTDDTLSILLGDGTGNFTLKENPLTGANPSWVAVGDFNNDGILDLAVANAGTVLSRGSTVTVMLGKGDGTFPFLTATLISSEGYSPVAVAVGDFNNNGNLDLAVLNACGTNATCMSAGKAAILLGDGGTPPNFTPQSNTATGFGPSALAVADLNGDGKLDVAVADATLSVVSILLGDGAGNLSLQTSPAPPMTGASPSSIAIGDFNGDGGLDLVTANNNSVNASVLLEAPKVTLACGASHPPGTTCTIAPLPGYAASLSFGSEPAGGAVGPMTLTLTNSGNLTLTVTSLGVASGAANFAVDPTTTACGAVPFVPPYNLSAGANCTIGVNFTPTSQGLHGGLIQIYDNAPGSPQNITLTGTGTAAAASVSPTTLAFGNVPPPGPSAAKTVTLSTGGAPLTITSIAATSPFVAQPNGTDGSNCGSTLAANSSCVIAVTFNPSATGLQSGTLTITDNTGGPTLTQTVSLSGTGIQAVASATPGSLTFTQVFGSTSVAQPVTLSNTGEAPLNFTGLTPISITGTNASEFTIQTNTCGTSSVPAYGNCTIYVTFTPSATGSAQTATLSIADNAGTGTQTVLLSGTDIKANTSSMITSNTPNPSIVGLTVTVNFTVTASPPGIGIPTGTVTVSDGTGDSCTGSLSGGVGSCSVPILTPSSPGPKPLTASYPGDSNFNASISPAVSQTVTKASTTTAITSPIPALVVGQPLSISFKVTPPSGDNLTPTGTVTVSDGAGDSCVATLTSAGGGALATGSCNLTPTTPATKTLTATYSGDRNFKSSTTSLTNALAVGDFSISVTPATAILKPGTTNSFTLTLTPLGGFTGTVSLTCSDPHPFTTCTLGSNSVPLVGAVPIKVSVFSDKSPVTVGTTTLTLTGKFGSGNPLTGGLTHSASALITMPVYY
jgi:hypothetical protein